MGFAPVAVAGLGDAVSELLKKLAQRIAGGERITADRRLLRETAAEYIAALEHGYGKTLTGVAWDSPDFETLQRLTENVYHFSAAKNWHELHDLTAAMRDGDRLRSFEQFEEEAQRIIGKYNSQWLRTEYNQAVAAAQAGARWNDFSRNADAMPYLRYQCIMDGNTRPEHAALDGVIKRIDDTFWDEYMPPNGWGCRCEAVQLPGSDYHETPDDKIHPPFVPDMFRVNFGKKGVAFPAGHAYFKKMPREEWRKVESKTKNEVLDYYRGRAKRIMPSYGADLTEHSNLQTGKLKRNANARDRLLEAKHSRTAEEINAAQYAWNNPDKLVFERISPMGEHKDLTNEEHVRNLANKTRRRVEEYLQYKFEYKGEEYHIKLEKISDGFEQFYSLTKP